MTNRSEPTRPRVFWVSRINRVVVLADRRIDDDPWLRLPGVSTMLSDADGGPGAIPASTVELVPAENLDERKRHTEACEGVNTVIHDMGLGGEFAPIDPDDPTDLADVVLNLCQGMVAARRERDEARRERDALAADANAEVSPSAAEQVRVVSDLRRMLTSHFGEMVSIVEVPHRVSDLITGKREQERAAEAARRSRQIVVEQRDQETERRAALIKERAALTKERDVAYEQRDTAIRERDRFQTSAQAAGTESLELASKLSDLRTRLGELARDA